MRFKIFGKTESMTLLGEVDGEWQQLFTTPIGHKNFQFAFDSDKPALHTQDVPEPKWEPMPGPVLHGKSEAKARKKSEDNAY